MPFPIKADSFYTRTSISSNHQWPMTQVHSEKTRAPPPLTPPCTYMSTRDHGVQGGDLQCRRHQQISDLKETSRGTYEKPQNSHLTVSRSGIVSHTINKGLFTLEHHSLQQSAKQHLRDHSDASVSVTFIFLWTVDYQTPQFLFGRGKMNSLWSLTFLFTFCSVASLVSSYSPFISKNMGADMRRLRIHFVSINATSAGCEVTIGVGGYYVLRFS